MGKINNLLLWLNLLNSSKLTFQQRYFCDEIEKRFPIKLIRTYSLEKSDFVNEANTQTILKHLTLLEEEVKV